MSAARQLALALDDPDAEPYCHLCAVNFYIATRCPVEHLQTLAAEGDAAALDALEYRLFLANVLPSRARPNA